MDAFLLILVVLGITVQHITKKMHTKRSGGGPYTFSAIGVLAALLFFVATSGGSLHFNLAILPHAIGFAATYSLSIIFTLLSIKEGPLSITTLITSYSLLIPTLYGLIAWNEPFSFLLLSGILLLVVSIFLIRFEGISAKNENAGKEGGRLTGKWLLFISLAFIGSGGCSTVQKGQQLYFNGAYKNEFMILALSISFLAFLICALVTEERKSLVQNIRCGGIFAAVGGLANGAVNLILLILSTKMDASVMFPIISTGGILCATAISVTIYKEKLSLLQKIGVILGVMAIVVLNI